MKRQARWRLALAVLGVALGWLTTSVWADDKAGVSGTWKGTLTRPDGQTTEFTLKLKQEGDKLTGVSIRASNNEEIPISDGKVKDGTLSFNMTRERDGQKFTLKYSGKLSGDTIKGKIDVNFNGQDFSLDWEAKRATEK
ncbi:MAG: hypothetical protein L0Z62_29565 [Gemmataceae bacterium]|nr:hypothetical protein [Gemmataceae bacterium]